jgi:hypothetical protein
MPIDIQGSGSPTPPTAACDRIGLAIDVSTIAHYGMQQLYVKDPDGCNVSCQAGRDTKEPRMRDI